MAAYDKDLAYIHDVGHGDFARDAGPGLLEILRGAGIVGGLVIDLGCGSGIWARQLSDAGYDVLGIDQSAAMLAIARTRAPRARFEQASFLDAALPPCAAVTAVGEVLNYLLDERNSTDAVRGAFERVHDALAPGGLFVFDVAGPGRGDGPPQRHRIGDDWAVLSDVHEDAATRILTRRITSFRAVAGGGYRRDTETHRLLLYPRNEVVMELERVGYEVRTAERYGAKELFAATVAFLAQKPARDADTG